MAFIGIAPLLNLSSFPTILSARFILKLAKEHSGNKWILKDISQELKLHTAFLTPTLTSITYNIKNQFFNLKKYINTFWNKMSCNVSKLKMYWIQTDSSKNKNKMPAQFQKVFINHSKFHSSF